MLQDLQICTKQNKWALRSYSDKQKTNKESLKWVAKSREFLHLNNFCDLSFTSYRTVTVFFPFV